MKEDLPISKITNSSSRLHKRPIYDGCGHCVVWFEMGCNREIMAIFVDFSFLTIKGKVPSLGFQQQFISGISILHSRWLARVRHSNCPTEKMTCRVINHHQHDQLFSLISAMYFKESDEMMVAISKDGQILKWESLEISEFHRMGLSGVSAKPQLTRSKSILIFFQRLIKLTMSKGGQM